MFITTVSKLKKIAVHNLTYLNSLGLQATSEKGIKLAPADA